MTAMFDGQPPATGLPVQGLPAVLPSHCTLLLLGSLPGRASLAAASYYAHPRNQFWQLMELVTGEALAAQDYPTRLSRLGARGVGLWDVIASARRASSLDSDIRDAATNPLMPLLETLPDLRAIACNGALAAKTAARLLHETALPVIALPSSSPAYTRSLADKAREWQVLRAHLLPPD
ncbi:G/U mismatch-specific uracil-DNA glycosylase [Blastomonas natatoria]|uniref:G/U mismatch-specific uracil-DNA glycosylase n=1 Tax=Blastomonas natatoria TaxID=34015 RepID=A0A2V3V5E6_9SPHN|nr:DNA-deoxyinosine glycosylase [Blastomonas natatoria]PXW76344.1 G/U mismatch-specific uracil-DNA glycosylase [Blastomonas natatoria]